MLFHQTQYIILNAAIAKRKYAETSCDLPLKNGIIALIVAGVVAIAILSIPRIAGWSGFGLDKETMKLIVAVSGGILLTHNWFDAFLWRFKDKFIHDAMLPYIRSPRQSASMDRTARAAVSSLK